MKGEGFNTEARRNGETEKIIKPLAASQLAVLSLFDQFHRDQDERRRFGRGDYPAGRLGQNVEYRGYGGQDCQHDGKAENLFIC